MPIYENVGALFRRLKRLMFIILSVSPTSCGVYKRLLNRSIIAKSGRKVNVHQKVERDGVVFDRMDVMNKFFNSRI